MLYSFHKNTSQQKEKAYSFWNHHFLSVGTVMIVLLMEHWPQALRRAIFFEHTTPHVPCFTTLLYLSKRGWYYTSATRLRGVTLTNITGTSKYLFARISILTLSKGDNTIWILYVVYNCIKYGVIIKIYCVLDVIRSF